MNAARMAVLTDIRVRAIDRVPDEKTEMRARVRQRGTPALSQHHRRQHGRERLETTGSAAERRHQPGSLRHREPIDGTEVTERTAV